MECLILFSGYFNRGWKAAPTGHDEIYLVKCAIRGWKAAPTSHDEIYLLKNKQSYHIDRGSGFQPRLKLTLCDSNCN